MFVEHVLNFRLIGSAADALKETLVVCTYTRRVELTCEKRLLLAGSGSLYEPMIEVNGLYCSVGEQEGCG